jgi:hypothetical protein
MYLVATISFCVIAYKFYKIDNLGFKLFSVGLALMAVVKFCALGVTMLWQFLSINFKSLEYLVYIFAIILFFASAATALKPKSSRLILVFLGIISILVAGLYIINPTLSGAGVYQARYVLSVDNPTTLNLFAMIVALSFGLATLVNTTKISNKTTKTVTEIGFLVIIIAQVLNILSYSDTLKFVSSIIGETALVVLAITAVTTAIKIKK